MRCLRMPPPLAVGSANVPDLQKQKTQDIEKAVLMLT